MFFSQVILSRKGPLGKIWLAAHFDKKLSKQQIFSTDITVSVESVMNPSVPLALRVSGHLMLGIVRIYAKKVRYLMTDCTDAMWKMKLAFRPGNVDIDPAVIAVSIDDLRHFGNIQLEEVELGYEQIAFSAQPPTDLLLRNLPSPLLSKNKQVDRRVSDIEHARGEYSSKSPLILSTQNSLPASRPPSLLPIPSSSKVPQISRFSSTIIEAELPAFEEGFLNFEDYSLSFTAPPSLPQDMHGGETWETEAARDEARTIEHISEVCDEPLHDIGAVSREEEKEGKTVKRKRVEAQRVMGAAIELSERMVKQRIENSDTILRRRAEDGLPLSLPNFATHSSLPSSDRLVIIAERSLDSRLLSLPHYRNICPELQYTINICLNSLPLPFPCKQLSPYSPIVSPSDTTSSRHAISVEGARGLLTESEGGRRIRQSDVSLRLGAGASGSNYDHVIEELPAFEHDYSYNAYESQTESADLQVVDHSDNSHDYVLETANVTGRERLTMSAKTEAVLQSLRIKKEHLVNLDTFCLHSNRKKVAGFFLELLQLKSWDKIDLEQSLPYGDIAISVL